MSGYFDHDARVTVNDYSELERNKLRVLEGLVFQGLESLLSLKLKRNMISDLMDGTFWGLSKILSLWVLHCYLLIV